MTSVADPPPFTVAMLAGGRSTRMGADKATLVLDRSDPNDVQLGERVLVAALLAGASQVLAVGGDRDALASQGWTTVEDRWPGEGPLGGIISALTIATNDIVVVVACDLPDVDPDGLLHLATVLADAPGAVAAVPVREGRREVLHAAYRAAHRGDLEAAFASGVRAPSAALQPLAVIETTVAPASLADLDTPADVEEYLGRRDA